jgi:hypothetical protein
VLLPLKIGFLIDWGRWEKRLSQRVLQMRVPLANALLAAVQRWDELAAGTLAGKS